MATVDDAKSQASTIIQSLQLGSGVDVQALARSLAEAENSPRIEQVKARQASVEASISGYGLVSVGLDSLRQGFSSLGNYSSLITNQVEAADTSVLSATADSTARAGVYQIAISQLASAQTLRSASFSSASETLNGGVDFALAVSVGATDPVSYSISVTDKTPAGVVDAINESDTGLTATLVNKSAEGDDWYILVEGETGADNSFSMADVAGLGFADVANLLVSAGNAQFSVNGLTGIERASNTVNDIITGLSLELKEAGGSAQTISVRQSTQPLRDAIDDLVLRYNDLQTIVTDLVSPDSSASEYSGSLQRDKSLTNSLLRQVRDLFEEVSTTASGGVSTLKDLGLIFQRDGSLALDETVFDQVMADSSDDVIQMLSAGTNGEDSYSGGDQGLGTAAADQLEALLENNGVLQLRIDKAENRVTDYQAQLDRLEERLESARIRYVQQFAVMEAFVEKTQGVGDYLKDQFEAMRNSNN